MAYASSGLSLLGYANGFSLWHYTSTDSAATIDSTNYFNSAAGQLAVGDFIFAHADTGGTPAYGVFVVLSNTGTVVDTGDMVAFKSADTD